MDQAAVAGVTGIKCRCTAVHENSRMKKKAWVGLVAACGRRYVGEEEVVTGQ